MEKEEICRFGHQCTSRCMNDIECPCQDSHCCALTENCDGSCDDCYNKNNREFSSEQLEIIEKLKEEEHCFCKSYFDENNLLQDCTCGKCK